MPTRRKYLLNPAPFVMGVINPAMKKKKKHPRKNSAKKSRRAGIKVLRKPTRNPRPKKRVKHRAKKNSFQLKHILVENATRRPAKKKKQHRKNPSSKKSTRPAMSKKHRAKKKHYKKNPSSKRRRKSSRRMRNPMGAIREVFNPNMLIVAGSAIATNVGINMVMNRLVVGDATGKRPFDLPGVDYTQPPSLFYQKNGYILAAYKLLIGAGVGYLLRNQSARVSQGAILGATITAGSDVFRTAGLINAQGTIGTIPGLSRNYPARNGTGFLPGTNTRFTGPAQSFLSPTSNSVPRPRGMGAAVGPNMLVNTQDMVEGSFRGAN